MIGVGGLGHLAVQILRALSSYRIIAVDLDEAKLGPAREVGADETVRSGETASVEVRELTLGLGAELVLDMVGSEQTMALAAACGRVEGDLVVVGLAGGTLTYGFGALPWECALTITYWATASWPDAPSSFRAGSPASVARSSAAAYQLTPLRRLGNLLITPLVRLGLAGNARAAGEVELRRAGRRARYAIEELGAEEAAPGLRAYLRTTRIVKPYFEAQQHSPLGTFAAEADRHPAFRLHETP